MYEPKQLEEILKGVEGKVLIQTHDSADGDAIASSYSWREILAYCGVEADIAYSGEIASAENQRLRNYLSKVTKYDMIRVDKDGLDYSKYNTILGIDVAKAESGNVTMPGGERMSISIDHHGENYNDGDFEDYLYYDVRKSTEVGSTSTMTALYMKDLGIELDPDNSTHCAIATALTVGMAIDTRNFINLTKHEIPALSYLNDAIDLIERKKLLKKDKPRNVIIGQGMGMANSTKVSGVYSIGFAGRLNQEYRETLVYVAEELLGEEGVTCGIACGIIDGKRLDIVVRADEDNKRGAEKVAQWWGGGGRVDAAAADYDLSLFIDLEEGDQPDLDALVEKVVIEKVRRETGEQQEKVSE